MHLANLRLLVQEQWAEDQREHLPTMDTFTYLHISPCGRDIEVPNIRH